MYVVLCTHTCMMVCTSNVKFTIWNIAYVYSWSQKYNIRIDFTGKMVLIGMEMLHVSLCTFGNQ